MHIIMIACASVSLLTFYPIITLLSPNFQFLNKALDFKFEQGFLIIEHQAQLMVAGFSVFYSDSWPFVLGPQLVICLVLAAYGMRVQPCIIKHMNVWKNVASVESL